MSNPPAGWYPDPTGQPKTIRWWNGTQWTNKTEKENEATSPATEGADQSDDTNVDPAPMGTTPAPEPAQPAEPTAPPAPTTPEPELAQPTWTQPVQTPEPRQQPWGQTGEQVRGAGQQQPPKAPNPWQSTGPGNAAHPPRQPQQPQQPSFGPPLSPTFDHPERSGKGPRDPRLPLVIAGAMVLVLIVAGGVWFLLRSDSGDPESGQTPGPTQTSGNPTQNSTTPPTSGPTTPATTPTGGPGRTPGQSRNPAMHGGSRIASDAISFPRLRPPWSDKKRFARQVTNSHGQYVLLQENIAGPADWYATIFVGSLSTAVLYNGNPQATANDLALELRNSYYTPIPITARTVRQFAVNRSGHRGWAVQQIITTTTRGVQSPTLVLMVAVFDLGDGTAVVYVSEIPPNRRDLSVFEQLVFKKVAVG